MLPWLMLAVWIGLAVGSFSLAGKLDSVTRDNQADYLPADAQSTKVLQAEAGLPGGFPRLKIIVGHMGEGLPFYYERIANDMGEPTEDSLDRPFEQYFQDNFWFTTSAFFQDNLLHLLLKYISVDRVLFATDYPFIESIKEGTDWFRAVDLPRADNEKIAFRNAENLFGIKV